MKRIANAVGKFTLCAATAIALSAQTFTTLATFDGTDGLFPVAPVVQAINGDFYGTTREGGTHTYDLYSAGTVFKITPSGALATLYDFCTQGSYPNCTDGAWPMAGLVQAANGDLYGTTSNGGATSVGTVFKITPGAR